MKTVKKYWKPVLVVSAFFIGNRVFNHINAWLGISIIMLTVAFIAVSYTHLTLPTTPYV